MKVEIVFKMNIRQMSPPEMVNSVNPFISAGRKVTVEDIPEQQRISMVTPKIILNKDFAFSNFNCCWVSAL